MGGEDGASYAGFLLPGMVTMVVLFSAIFASMSLIQDRQGGFLQSVLVSPAPSWAIAGAKVLGGTVIATTQALVLLLGAIVVGLAPGAGGWLGAALASALVSVAVIGLGLAAAWRINSTAGFHGVMNMVLMPMWLLSGALFPAEGAAGWLRAVMLANPLHWATRAMGGSLGIGPPAGAWAWAGTLLFAAAMFGAACLAMRTRTAGTAGPVAE
ncbi:MAG TPA: hypothetical protein DEB06_00315 [Phycisphaerales bacterium]|nr:hypothetical protein [Phycisphaerales bacterium]